jgi:predicted ArsR family transcriptional regulator
VRRRKQLVALIHAEIQRAGGVTAAEIADALGVPKAAVFGRD